MFPQSVYTVNAFPRKEVWRAENPHIDHSNPAARHRTSPRPFRIAALLYLEDVGEQAGGTAVWPGSHVTVNALRESDPRRFRLMASLNERIRERTRSESTEHWIERLNKAGVPCGPIYSIDRMFEDPQVKHLGLVESMHSPALGEISMVGQPFTLSRTDSRLRSASPERGEHSTEVLREFGFEEAEIAGLRARGVV